MNAPEALARLKALGVPVVTTSDAAAVLRLSTAAASHTLRRLARAGLVMAVRKGLWLLDPKLDPLALAEYLTAPYPSYVSLQTALYRHGMISQIPSVTYAVTLGRELRISTPLGAYSFHHLPPEFFGGWADPPRSGVKLATPEKALADYLYLTPTRTRLFARLPELELPEGFDTDRTAEWLRHIPSRRLRTIAERRLAEVLRELEERKASERHPRRPKRVGRAARSLSARRGSRSPRGARTGSAGPRGGRRG
jgi:hypothetical protein